MDPCFSFSFPSSAFLLQAAGLEWTQILNWCSRYFTHTHTHQHHVRVVCPTISVTGFTSTSCRDWPAARSQESSLILYFSLVFPFPLDTEHFTALLLWTTRWNILTVSMERLSDDVHHCSHILHSILLYPTLQLCHVSIWMNKSCTNMFF